MQGVFTPCTVLISLCLAAQVYALAFWYGGRLVAWHEASFGDILKVHALPVSAAHLTR